MSFKRYGPSVIAIDLVYIDESKLHSVYLPLVKLNIYDRKLHLVWEQNQLMHTVSIQHNGTDELNVVYLIRQLTNHNIRITVEPRFTNTRLIRTPAINRVPLYTIYNIKEKKMYQAYVKLQDRFLFLGRRGERISSLNANWYPHKV